jgi:hypothetical protein
MRKRLTRSLGRRLLVAALTAAWVLAPAAPALACAVATLDDASMQASMPDCHGGTTKSVTDETERPAHHPCCSDAETSCCLRALDVDGAITGLLALDGPTVVALPAAVPTVPSFDTPLASSLPAVAPDVSPPGCPFRILRL